MVCAPEAQREITATLGITPTLVTVPTWTDHVYSCTYQYPDGSFVLSVKELDNVKADNSIAEADKKQLVDQLTDAIKSTPKVEHKENVDIVKAHRAEIEKALQ